MLILGREAPETAGVGSEVAEPAAAFVSGVEVMQHILVAATDTMTRGPLRRLQELATRAARKSGRRLRATKEANLRAGRFADCRSSRRGLRGSPGAGCERRRRRICARAASPTAGARDAGCEEVRAQVASDEGGESGGPLVRVHSTTHYAARAPHYYRAHDHATRAHRHAA